jgi:hypothetical protein
LSLKFLLCHGDYHYREIGIQATYLRHSRTEFREPQMI